MDSHVQYILSQCSQRLYLLKVLKRQGMPKRQLAVVAQSIIISRILYAVPAWGEFLTAWMINRLMLSLNVLSSLAIFYWVFYYDWRFN